MAASGSVMGESACSDGGEGLRLLILSSDNFPPCRVDVAVLFGEEIAARGHRIDWILQSEAPCEKAYRAEWGGGIVHVGPTDLGSSLLRRLRKHVRGIVHDLNVVQLLRTGDYNVVEVKDKFLSGIVALIAARSFGKPFVYWLSFPYPEDYLYRARTGHARWPWLYRIRGLTFKWLLYKLLLPAADHVFVQSEQMRDDLTAEGVPREKMTPVPMGIKLEGIGGRLGRRTLIPPGEPCFLYLGTLARARRLDFLVRVLRLVRRSVPDAKLYVVGAGDLPGDEQVLQDEAERLGLVEALVLVGRKPRAEALRYVEEADVCVSPFYPTPILNSTSPTKLVEYMALGKAVVANDHPEQRRIIAESEGGYCVPWQEGAFADAIADLLGSPEKRARMGEQGRLYVVRHRSYAAIADLVEARFLSIAGRAEAVI